MRRFDSQLVSSDREVGGLRSRRLGPADGGGDDGWPHGLLVLGLRSIGERLAGRKRLATAPALFTWSCKASNAIQ